MQVIGVVGPSDSGKTTLIERLASRLSKRGRVGTVKHINCTPDLDTEGKDTARHRSAGASQTIGVAEEVWFATGENRSLSDALDSLAPSCDFALVEGYRSLALPKIVLGAEGESEYDAGAGEVLLSAATAEDVALDDAVAVIEAVPSYETVESLVASARDAHGSDPGAVATLRVRGDSAPASARMEAIREQVEAGEGVQEVRLHSPTVEPGESALIAVALAEDYETANNAVVQCLDE